MDVDSVLSAAVLRVLEGSPTGTGLSLDKKGVRFARKPPQRPQVQQSNVRLMAVQIVKRVERRFEERLHEMRLRDQIETDRRLHEIQEDFRSEKDALVRKIKANQERRRFEDQLRDRESAIRHQMSMELEEREAQLESDRRMLETRLIEFLNAKDQFELEKQNWKSKMDDDSERLEIERSRLQMMETNLLNGEGRARRLVNLLVQEEENKQAERMRELEEKVSTLTRKLTDAGSQNFEMRQLLDEKLVIEEELQSTRTLLHKLSKENKELNEKLKSMQSYDDVVEENTRLRKEVHTLRENSEQHARIMSEMERRQREYKIAEEANSLKISELRHALGILNDRVGNLNTERAYLRSQLNIARTKSVAKGVERSQPRINDPLEQNYQSKHSHGRRRNDEVCSSCLSSEDDSDIEGIRNRLARLDTIARGLNAQMPSSDASSAWDRTHANEPTRNETYDDYCRNQSLYSDAGRVEYPRTSTPNENTRIDGGPFSKHTRFTSTRDASLLNTVDLGVTQPERRRHEDTALGSSGPLTDAGGGETSKNVPESVPLEVNQENENVKEKKGDEEGETGNGSVAQENSLMGQYMALLRKSATEETKTGNATLEVEVREMIPPQSVSDDGIEDVIVSVDKPADGDSEFEW